MKYVFYFLSCVSFVFLFQSCSNDETQLYQVAIPIYENMETFRNAIDVQGAKSTTSSEDGKIYVTQDHLFYIAQESGVHVFDNSNPEAPFNIAFIEIPGVHDIAIKDGFLYADNYRDLLVFDVNDLGNIQLVQTLEEVQDFYPEFPEDVQYSDWSSYDYQEGDFLLGYRIEYREEIPEVEVWLNDGVSAPSNGGTGGSFAKFQLNSNALYTASSSRVNVFDISSPENVSFSNYFYPEQWVGQFETMYKLKQYIFIGSTQGMAVFDASDAFNLQFVSSFSHATGCDPVIADSEYAYLTIRGGNTCGAVESQVNVIDIEDITSPTLTSTYYLENPYGLGKINDVLYVGTGEEGLKIFDASNPHELVLQNQIEVNAYDVIPLTSKLVLVGGRTVIQYEYSEDFTLEEISRITF